MILRSRRVAKLIARGDRSLEGGELDEAERLYREALTEDPRSGEALYSIGCVASRRGDHSASLDWARQTLEAEPTHAGALNLAGNALLGLDRPEEALTYLQAAEAKEPSLLTSVQIALALELTDELETAEELLRSALADDPTYATRHAGIAIYSIAPIWADLHARLARVLQKRDAVEEARLHYHLAKRIDPLVELDPLYLEIMTKEELEDHPIDRIMDEEWADHLDLDALGDAAEPARAILALTRSPDLAALQDAARREDAQGLVPLAADMIRATQSLGWYTAASVLRVVGDCLNGDDVSELFPSVRSTGWRRLLEIAERIHEGDWSEHEALAAAAREGPASSPALLVAFTRRFVQADARTGLVLARVVDAALGSAADTRTRLESTMLVGDASRKSGDLASAEAAFAKVIGGVEGSADADLLLPALDRLGRTQGERGRSQPAVETFRRYIAEADAVRDEMAALEGRYNLAVALGHSGLRQEAYEAAVETATAARSIDAHDRGAEVAELLRWAASKAGVDPPEDLLAELRAAAEDPVEDLLQDADRLNEGGQRDEALAVLESAEATERARASRPSALGRILQLRGHVLSEIGRVDEACAAVEAAIAALPTRDAGGLHAAHRSLALIHRDAGQTGEAVEALERALAYARTAQSIEDAAETHELLAMLVRDDDPELAIYHMGKAIHLRSPRHAEDRVRRRFAELALAATAAGPDSASVLEQMVAELAEVESPPDRRDVALETGVAALTAGRPDLAEQPLLESVSLAADGEWRDAEQELSGRQALGTAYRQTGRYAEAIEQYQAALKLAERLRDDLAAALVRGRLAIALRYVDRLDDAAAEYREALVTLRRYDHRDAVAVNQMNFASTLFLLGRTGEAVDAAHEALAIFDAEGEAEMALRTLAMLATSAVAQDLPPELVERLHEEAAQSSDPLLAGWSASENAGRLLEEEGDLAAAERELERATEIHRSRGDRFNEAQSHLNRSRLLGPFDADRAAAAAQTARQIAVDIGQRQLEANAEEQLLWLALAAGDDDAVDRLLASLVPFWNDRRRALHHDRDRIALADDVTPLLKATAAHFLNERRLDRTFDVLDHARAQALTDAIVVRGELSIPTEGLLDRVRDLLQSVRRPAVAVTLDLVGGSLIAGSLRADQSVPTFVDTGIAEAEVARVLESFREEMLVYRGHGPQTWEAGARRLIAPAANDVRDGDLVVLVLDGDLQQLPLHAVGLPRGVPVVHAPSFAVLELSRSRPGSRVEPFSKFVSVGVSFPDEARAVELVLGGAVLSSRRLDKEVVQPVVADATIVHFACHGFFDTDDVLDSGLLLSTSATPTRSEVLSLRDLVDWRLHAELVVLSACETGLGKVVPSDFLGLARGILAAGARAVIVTLWPVEDTATQALMLELYATMARQRDETGTIDVALALAVTQERFAQTHRPYDWAAFKLVGWPEIEWSGPR